MNAFVAGIQIRESLADLSLGIILIVKLTLLLSLAWLAQWMLSKHNPRWRVALWRGVMTGLLLIGVFSFFQPMLRWDVFPNRPAVETRNPEIEAASLARDTIPNSRLLAITPPAVELDEPVRRDEDSIRQERMGWVSWLLTFWAVGVFVLASRLIAGMLQVSRILRRAGDVPLGIDLECREVASRLGCTKSVRVRASDGVPTPCLVGILRQVLLIPKNLQKPVELHDLRAILAHELAHARNNDVLWNLAAHLTSIVLWFHPLIWRMQATHAAACEAVCDAIAADYLGDTPAYMRTLARVALHTLQPLPVQGLAMARTSDVLLRIEAMNRQLFRQPLPRKWLMTSGLVGSAFAMLIGGLRLSRAEPPADVKSKISEGRITLRAVESATGKPLEGINIKFQKYDGKWRNGTVDTGRGSTATIDWKGDTKLHRFTITARKPKFVPIHLAWTDENHPMIIPAEEELRFELGTSLDGQVRDESGKPIVGASVEVLIPANSENPNYYFDLGNLTTDATGRWHLDEAPARLLNFLVKVQHPKYRPQNEHVPRSKSIVNVLKKGLTLSGRVLDLQGKPVTGAQAIIGHDIWGSDPPKAKTDETGQFLLENCPAGPSLVTVQADASAPQFRDVLIDDRSPSLEFRLDPGSTVRVKFVDVAGKPIEGASLNADTWHNHRSLDMRAKSGPDGRVEWRGAPPDAVIYHCYKEGITRIPDLSLLPSDQEQVVTMYPPLVITGKVTDAKTGLPIPSFRAIKGMHFKNSNRTYWTREAVVEFVNGQYALKSTDGYEGNAVRIEAPGYKPAESRTFKPEEGTQTFDFSLEPGQGIVGIVVGADGRVVKAVDVAIATRENQPYIHNAELSNNGNIPLTKTDAEGKFALPVQEGAYLLLALGEPGYAFATSVEFAKSGKLVLKPWGRIRGQVQIGNRLGALQQVSFQATLPDDRLAGFVNFGGDTAKADEKGRFLMDHILPGKGHVGRVVVTEYGNGITQHLTCWQEPVEVAAGETARVTVGGKGRPVVGRIVLDSDSDAGSDWRRYTTVNLQRRPGKSAGGTENNGQYVANMDKNGRFRVDDIPPGDYQLSLSAERPLMSPLRAEIKGIGELKRDLTISEIPDGQTDEAVDLGTMTAKLLKPAKGAEAAP